MCHAFCLMPNHYHLVIETPAPTLAEGMRDLNSTYARRFNVRHARIGHLFAARYKSIRLEREEHFLELCRYLVLNPARAANGVARPEDARWTSYAATAGLAEVPPFLTVDSVLARFARRRSEACRRYREFVTEALSAA